VECSGAASDDGGDFIGIGDQVEADNISVAVTDQPLLPTPPGSPRRRLTRAAPASMPYMTLRRGGVLKPCSQGEGSNACDVCAEAGAGNSARIAALKHASL
jgi:hypothetical protein